MDSLLAARRAGTLLEQGRHLILSGDPVAAGEVLAAPSAVRCGGIAVCLLDLSADAQTARLTERGDPPELLPLHLAFAQWMREHALDPLSRLEALTSTGSSMMRWDRLAAAKQHPGRWHVHVLDTSDTSPADVATSVMNWIAKALLDDSMVMRPELWGRSLQ